MTTKQAQHEESPRIPARLPVVRWAGGKRAQAVAIAGIARRYLDKTGGRYVEPFLGGAAVALELDLGARMVLNDGCAALISMYDALRARPELVISNLASMVKARGVSAEAYDQVRSAAPTTSPYYEAARFLYLNTTNFNGLYRENTKGEYNVPYGHPRRTPGFLTLAEARTFAAVMRDATLIGEDFTNVTTLADAGDFVFCDPPYWGGFSDYLAAGFELHDHQALADELRAAQDRSVAWLQTNSDTPQIRKMYAWAHLGSATERRAIAADAKRRVDAPCLVIASHKDLLEGIA